MSNEQYTLRGALSIIDRFTWIKRVASWRNLCALSITMTLNYVTWVGKDLTVRFLTRINAAANSIRESISNALLMRLIASSQCKICLQRNVCTSFYWYIVLELCLK